MPSKVTAPLLAAAMAAVAAAPALSAAEGQTAAPPASGPASSAPATAEDLLPNARQPLPHLLTGGQPSSEQLESLAAAGYRTVIDLRPEGEKGAPADEAERVAALGMRYVRIPIAGTGDLSEETARALDEVLDGEAAYPAVVHCASGNRVGALLALRAAGLDGVAPEAALELGLDAGLTGLEPAVRDLLGLPAAPAEPEP